MKRILVFGLILFLVCAGILGTSCTSRKSACYSDWQYKSKKLKKNRSNYGTIYDVKTKPVRKSYFISNKR